VLFDEFAKSPAHHGGACTVQWGTTARCGGDSMWRSGSEKNKCGERSVIGLDIIYDGRGLVVMNKFTMAESRLPMTKFSNCKLFNL
jgi:hypothetical protein